MDYDKMSGGNLMKKAAGRKGGFPMALATPGHAAKMVHRFI